MNNTHTTAVKAFNNTVTTVDVVQTMADAGFSPEDTATMCAATVEAFFAAMTGRDWTGAEMVAACETVTAVNSVSDDSRVRFTVVASVVSDAFAAAA